MLSTTLEAAKSPPDHRCCLRPQARGVLALGVQTHSLQDISSLMSDLPCIAQPTPLFHRIWPVAGLVAAVVVNVAWMGFLGYGFFKLIGPAFF
jgi:hypothetical protein